MLLWQHKPEEYSPSSLNTIMRGESYQLRLGISDRRNGEGEKELELAECLSAEYQVCTVRFATSFALKAPKKLEL